MLVLSVTLLQVTTWAAVGLMAIIAIISWSRVFSWLITKCCYKQERTEYHQYRHLQNN